MKEQHLYWLYQRFSQMGPEEVKNMIGFMTPLEETRAYKEIAAQATAKLRAEMTAKVEAVTAEAKAKASQGVAKRDKAVAEWDKAVAEWDKAVAERDKAVAEAKKAKAEAKEAHLQLLNDHIQTITQLHETGVLNASAFDQIMSGLLEQRNKLQ